MFGVFHTSQKLFTHKQTSLLPVIDFKIFALLWTHCNWTLSVQNPLGHPFTLSSAITRDTHTCCRAFGSGTGSDCFNNSCLYRRRIEWRVKPFLKMFKRWYSENTLTTLNNRFFRTILSNFLQTWHKAIFA